MAEVYAGFLAHADHHIGRLLDYLEDERSSSRTRIVVVMSDNGASGEGGPNGSVNEKKIANNIPDDSARTWRRSTSSAATHLQPLPDRLGDGVQHPVQDVEALRVQRRHLRSRASSPGRPDDAPAARSASSTTTRSISSRPCWMCLGVEAPETIKGHTQIAVGRRQHA